MGRRADALTKREEPADARLGRLFDHPKHAEFLKAALPEAGGADSPAWRIPFCHHPPFSAGPQHHNTKGMDSLIRQFERAGVRVVLSGHEHNFQHSRANGVDYIVTGAAGKVRTGTPNKFTDARTVSWAAACHLLLVTVDGKRMIIRPVGELKGGSLSDIEKRAPNGGAVSGPVVIEL